MSKSGHTKNVAQLTLHLEDDIAEQEIPEGALEALAVGSWLDMSREDLLTTLAVYRKRKGLQPDLVKGCFFLCGAEVKQAEEQRQPKEGDGEKMMALAGPQPAAIHELVAGMSASWVENEALRQSLVPGLTIQTLNRIMGEQLPYTGISSLLVGLKEYQPKQKNWIEHELAQLIWNVVNEEFQARRRHIPSAPQGNQGRGGGGGSSSPRDSNMVRACCRLPTSLREIALNAEVLASGRQTALLAEQGGVDESSWWDKHKCSSRLKG